MREAAVPGYRLSKARRSTKILISLALIGTLLGLLSAVALTISRTGLSPTSVTNYYLGTPPSNTLDDAIVASGPRPVSELLEITHFHLMGGTLLLFLLCHLLSVCDVRDELRSTLYVTAFTSFVLTFGLPWAILFLGAPFSWGFAPSVVTLVVSLAVLSLIPLKEMWLPRD